MEELDEIRRREDEKHSLLGVLKGKGERANLRDYLIALAIVLGLLAAGFGIAEMDFGLHSTQEAAEVADQPAGSVEVKP